MKVTLFRDLPTEGWPSMERYADELASALQQLGCEVNPFVIARPLPQMRGVPGTMANYVWRFFIYPMAARTQRRQLNHIIDHSYSHLIDALDPRRTVITCHDIAPLVLDLHGRGLSHRLWQRSFRALSRAAHIIADSTHTRDEIVHHSSYPAERISVVPLAVSTAFFESVAPTKLQTLREQYHLVGHHLILHVGSCQPRKNIEVIVNAMTKLLDLNFVFVQVGGQFTKSQLSLIESLNLHRKVLQIASVPEDVLKSWYQLADVFVFPSLYEGFGLPILEAMACGVPVICANSTSLPEVAGDAAWQIDPLDPAAVAQAILTVITDLTRAETMRQRGLEQARTFSWERTACETLSVYNRVLSQS